MSKLYWIKNFSGGMDQITDPELVARNESPLLQNVTTDQPGNWCSRKGTSRLDSGTPSAGSVYGLGSYRASGGSETFMRVIARDWQSWGGSSWSNITGGENEFTASRKINFTNHLDRIYAGQKFTSGDTELALRYWDGSSISTVSPTISGGILTTHRSMIMVAGNKHMPNTVFFSDPYTDRFHRTLGAAKADSATCRADADEDGTGYVAVTTDLLPPDSIGGIIYNTTDGEMATIVDWVIGSETTSENAAVVTEADTSGWDDDTVYILQNTVTFDEPVTALMGYKENIIAWSEDKMYVFDPLSNWSDEYPNCGCVNERIPQIVSGSLVWCDRSSLYLWNGSGNPTDITNKIRDKVDGYGIWDLIDASNWGDACAGGFEGKYYLSVGDLETVSGAPASNISNAELVADLTKETFTLNTRDDQPLVYTTYKDSNGNKNIYYGESTNEAIYKMNTGDNDVDSADDSVNISVDMRTPHLRLGNDEREQWRVINYFIKYKSGDTVTVKHSVDQGDYSAVGTISASSNFTQERLLPPTESQGFTFSLQLTTTDTLTLSAIGIEVEKISYGDTAI